MDYAKPVQDGRRKTRKERRRDRKRGQKDNNNNTQHPFQTVKSGRGMRRAKQKISKLLTQPPWKTFLYPEDVFLYAAARFALAWMAAIFTVTIIQILNK
ncbi:hypothetical protein BIW11_07471 [Tropilaelaps mercedesae]|uniref:Uncharacterized protein n=1 Tax=Tropilaelaps mercedesae TaxID=418985 RepID=A0A1V9XTS9_9ACAR|nr:hypothetical protein BIW11_07471 [Tropilaelaps mercedesae]